jgi:transcriptional antiterminator NusG
MSKQWYVAHVHSGFEKRVKQAIEEQAESHGLTDLVEEVLVPHRRSRRGSTWR